MDNHEAQKVNSDSKNRKEISPKKILLAVVGGILCLVFSFALFCNLVIIVKGFIFPTKPPSVFGVTPMAMVSGSMSGTRDGHIEPGDLIFVDKVDPDDLKVGDVIAFMVDKAFVTHRIIEVQEDEQGNPMWQTKGDTNNAMDQDPVTADEIVGIYNGTRVPFLGNVTLFSRTPLGMILFIGVPVGYFLIRDNIQRRKSEAEAQKREAALEEELKRLRENLGN